jgi:hypothetical protein
MKLWFQMVVSLGILSISAASLSYTWMTWRAYDLETRANEVCKIYVETEAGDFLKGRNLGEAEGWFAKWQCINRVMGKQPWGGESVP